MKQTIVKLVDEILRRIEEHPEGAPTESGIRLWLYQQGYSKRDIEDAMRLVRPRFQQQAQIPESRPVAVRPLSEYETAKLTPEARSALARLELYGLIDPYEREMVLDRLAHYEGEVGMEELDYLLSWLVCSSRDYETQQTLFGIFEGQNDTVH